MVEQTFHEVGSKFEVFSFRAVELRASKTLFCSQGKNLKLNVVHYLQVLDQRLSVLSDRLTELSECDELDSDGYLICLVTI